MMHINPANVVLLLRQKFQDYEESSDITSEEERRLAERLEELICDASVFCNFDSIPFDPFKFVYFWILKDKHKMENQPILKLLVVKCFIF
jgi:hypothetical protein